VDAELNKVDDVATAAPAAAQEKTSSKSSVPDTVETAGLIFLNSAVFVKNFLVN